MVEGYSAVFLAALVVAVRYFYFESIDPNLKPIDVPQNQVKSKYDFIIVGAGSAGCVVANRLSEIADWNVLLIEAGGDGNVISNTPYLSRYLGNTRMDWNYTSVKQKRSCGWNDGICVYSAGHVLGGGSTINYMMYVRGNRADYDGWAANGNTEWSYDNVLSYFIKAENTTTTREFLDSSYHGSSGPLNVQYPLYRSPISCDYIKAGVEFGLSEGDYNGNDQVRVSLVQSTMDGPLRESAAKAYLDPIRDRVNLDVIENCLVTKIIIDPKSKTATGVEYVRDNETFTVSACKEVILSSGTVNSAQLLMLSGIGPATHLQSLGIDVIADLPVGNNVHDHPLVVLTFELNANASISVNNQSIYEYAMNRTGPLTTAGIEVVASLSTSQNASIPNIQWAFGENYDELEDVDPKLIIAGVTLLHPVSRGTVRLNSADPLEMPLIDPNLLDDDQDYNQLKEGIEQLTGFFSAPSMRKYNVKIMNERTPLCAMYPYDPTSTDRASNNDFIDCVIENYSQTLYHIVGSNKMGPKSDQETVVDQFLKVNGIKNLKVIDGSVIPNIPRGNTNAAVIMIGEKGADLTKRDYDI